MLHFTSKNKRILNMHEKRFSELENFQATTIVFQTNTNASLKNLETRIGQLALNIHNQSKDSIPSDTRKDARECMEVLLRSGRELDERRLKRRTLGKRIMLKLKKSLISTVQKLQRKRKQQKYSQSNRWKNKIQGKGRG